MKIILISILFSCCLISPIIAASCQVQISGASFDFSRFTINGGHYDVDDFADTELRNYIYEFNVCTAAVGVPSSCSHNGSSTLGPAYQTYNDTTGQCFALGSLESSSWSLYDETNPAAGAVLTYSGGDPCVLNGETKSRQFGINFVCGTSLAITPSSRVLEDMRAVCEYQVTFESAYACPTECPINSDGLLCSAHGFCGYDQDAKAARCFCNSGRQGAACEKYIELSGGMFSPISILVVIVIVLLVALLGMAALLFVKLRRLKQEDNPYGALEPARQA